MDQGGLGLRAPQLPLVSCNAKKVSVSKGVAIKIPLQLLGPAPIKCGRGPLSSE